MQLRKEPGMEEIIQQTNEGQEIETQPAAKTYSQEEVDKLIQAEADRRVTQALKKQEEKNASKVREAEKLARMNESEKFQYELEQREKAIVAKEKALAMAENKNVALSILSEKGISAKLVDFVCDEDADVMNERIKLLDSEFKKCVRAEVDKRLSSKTPTANIGSDKTVTRKDVRKMSFAELAKLKEEDPDAFRALQSDIYNK